MDDYRKYIHQSRYARWNEKTGRRETWEETVDRYTTFFDLELDEGDDATREAVKSAILDMEVMPSMRCLMTAGEALERDNVAGYNCAYTAVEGTGEILSLTHDKLDEPVVVHLSNPIDFDETMYVLMCGTGVGFSVERQYVNNLPKVGKKLNRRIYLPNNKNFPDVDKEELSSIDKKENTIRVHDSKYGWASALRILIVELYNGNFNISWDLSSIRPAGAKLKTFGGRASGPKPLDDLFVFAKELFKKAKGRKLTSLECHDLMCKVADIVVVGGVRRSALISLSNLTDERMRKAKMGDLSTNQQRYLSNNSVAYTEKPDVGIFLREMESLYESRSGERGIFNRKAAQKAAARSGRRETDNYEYGTNPCSEIILRSKQFCNLTEVVVRPNDTFDVLKRKVRIATILGTLQSTLTDFRYLSSAWKKNTEEERLLGVSLTGIMDHPVMSGGSPTSSKTSPLKGWLQELKEVAIETNKEWADKLGINPSTAITCVKPSGTVSQLVDSSSGIHPRFSPFYIRTVRGDNKDPLTQFLIKQGVPHEPAIGKEDSTTVFSFPMKAPKDSVNEHDVNAISQLELWKIYQENWCEHKPSITVQYTDQNYPDVMAWVWDNFDSVSGISFMPASDHVYKQAPYTEITEEEYNVLKEQMPVINWEEFVETEDSTTATHELACSSGFCEVL